MNIDSQLAKEFNIRSGQVKSTIELIDAGNTIPFISRYRKEATGGLDDELLRDLNERLSYLRNLRDRKIEVRRLIDEQEKLTIEIEKALDEADTMQKIEDIYRPFRPKKRTRALIAKEKGLEPLSNIIKSQEMDEREILLEADKYVSEVEGKEVESAEKAIQGAMDIIAENISDNAKYRDMIRRNIYKNSNISTERIIKKSDEEEDNKEKSKDDSKYEMYFDYSEPVSRIVSHRILAINRAEKEKVLRVKIDDLEEEILVLLENKVIDKNKPISQYLVDSIKDSYKRLIFPSIEREIRNELTEKADEQAIKVFGNNLKPLLMQAPIRDMNVIGYDPGYRTGSKLAALDSTGKLLDHATIYPTKPQNKIEESKKVLKKMIEDNNIKIVAIGNGTASRESEQFVADLIKEMEREVFYTIVNEAGASIYSASKLGTEEYPDLDVTIRGAISIGKRLQDPLAELVKIDPKHIGVGQYQHDLNQKRLEGALTGVVEDSVNAVGVDINTASPSLLEYVSGISKSVAKNILDYRNENGKFESRKELLDVKRLGNATFVQCAGFLRIPDSSNILDRTAVHPESYGVAKKLIENMNIQDELDLTKANWNEVEERVESLAKDLDIGVPTLKDIITELKKPGRDPREDMPKPLFRSDVLSMEDLEVGMIMSGTVRNVVDFGAFVDIGVKQDGLVHISEISNKRIKSPSDHLSAGDNIKVKVIGIDLPKKRVSLSIKAVEEQ